MEGRDKAAKPASEPMERRTGASIDGDCGAVGAVASREMPAELLIKFKFGAQRSAHKKLTTDCASNVPYNLLLIGAPPFCSRSSSHCTTSPFTLSRRSFVSLRVSWK